jgi:hypothetical protein
LVLKINCVIATLGPSWNFSLSDILASLSLQDGLQSGIIISQPPHKLLQIPPHKLWQIPPPTSATTDGSYSNGKHKLMRPHKTKLQLKTKKRIKIGKVKMICNRKLQNIKDGIF